MILFVISIIIWGIAFLFLIDFAEDALDRMLRNGKLPEKYLEEEGWWYDYRTNQGFLVSSILFILLYYGIHIIGNLRKILVSNTVQYVLVIFYVISLVVLTVIFPQVAVFLVPGIFILAIAFVHMYLYRKDKLQN